VTVTTPLPLSLCDSDAVGTAESVFGCGGMIIVSEACEGGVTTALELEVETGVSLLVAKGGNGEA